MVSADLTGLDTSNVTNMCRLFSWYTSLASLDLSGWDTSKVENMQEMFNLCCSLTSLDLSDLDTSSLKDMENMFYLCDGLVSLDLSGFDTSNVTEAKEMFDGCTSLASFKVGPAYEIKSTDMFPDATAQRGWWSTSDRQSYAKDEIVASRSKVADTYDNTGIESADISGASVVVEDQTYTGKALAYSGKVAKTGSADKVTYKYYADAKCTKAVKAASVNNAGTYYVKATVAADANHKAATSVAAKLIVKRAANPLAVKAATGTADLATLKTKAVHMALPLSITNNAKSKLTYVKVKGSASCFIVNEHSGKMTVKKGTKKGTYTIRIKVAAAKTNNYEAGSKTVASKVIVK